MALVHENNLFISEKIQGAIYSEQDRKKEIYPDINILSSIDLLPKDLIRHEEERKSFILETNRLFHGR